VESILGDGGQKIALRLERISKWFGGLSVLTDVHLVLYEGELLGLIGPNGAGKSTLFNLITSIYTPDSGDIYLYEKRITGEPSHRICRMGISRTFQLVKVFPGMTALQNVMVAAVFGHTHDVKASKERALSALDSVRLGHMRDVLVGHMTLSDRRLLEVARALASMPVVMLLDEPMAGLNSAEISKMNEVIERVRSERTISMLWVEHKVDAIFRRCDRVVVLDHGVKIADGRPGEIAKNAGVVEAYLGESLA
jgi:branched-chain amino acid transport system ATP-binding protein